MYQARIDAIAKSIINDVVSLQVIFDGAQGNREEAIGKLFTINRLARALLSGNTDPGALVNDSRAVLSDLRLALEDGDLAAAIKGLTENDLSLLLEDLDVSMTAVNRSLFNLLRNKEGVDGLEKPAA